MIISQLNPTAIYTLTSFQKQHIHPASKNLWTNLVAAEPGATLVEPYKD